jgi:hypothetical protein
MKKRARPKPKGRVEDQGLLLLKELFDHCEDSIDPELYERVVVFLGITERLSPTSKRDGAAGKWSAPERGGPGVRKKNTVESG